jgi:hypothetical protein
MGTRKRTARQFQVEAMEPRWTPGGLSGGVVCVGAACHIGEEIPQVHVAPLAYGSKLGIASGSNGVPLAYGSKLGIASGSN